MTGIEDAGGWAPAAALVLLVLVALMGVAFAAFAGAVHDRLRRLDAEVGALRNLRRPPR